MSEAPSQGAMAARDGGCEEAKNHYDKALVRMKPLAQESGDDGGYLSNGQP